AGAATPQSNSRAAGAGSGKGGTAGFPQGRLLGGGRLPGDGEEGDPAEKEGQVITGEAPEHRLRAGIGAGPAPPGRRAAPPATFLRLLPAPSGGARGAPGALRRGRGSRRASSSRPRTPAAARPPPCRRASAAPLTPAANRGASPRRVAPQSS